MDKIGHLDIDWQAFNTKIDNVEGVVKKPTEYNWPMKQDTYDTNYKVDEHHYAQATSIYTEYVSDDLIKYFLTICSNDYSICMTFHRLSVYTLYHCYTINFHQRFSG